MDIIAFFISILFLIWFAFLFFDCWRIFIIYNECIDMNILAFRLKKIKFTDVVSYETIKSNQRRYLIQGKILVLNLKDNKKIFIPKSMNNFDCFYQNFFNFCKKEGIPEI
jgi:hypothetical protein